MNQQVRVMILANYLAREEVKEQLRRQGIKLRHIEAREITAKARQYLNEHRGELIEQVRVRYASFITPRRG